VPISARQVGVDSTTLEANAAMKSIVRRDTGEDYQEYLNRLMAEEGAAERSFAHVCDTNRMRRQHVRELENVQKRYLIAAAGYSLGRLRR